MATETGNRELRHFPRMKAERVFSYRRASAPAEKSQQALTKVVGLGGLMFEQATPLALGEEYLITMFLDGRVLELQSRVAWILSVSGGSFQIGVEFLAVSGPDREFLLADFMRENYRIDME